MKTIVYALTSLLILGACSSEPNVIHLRTEKGQKNIKNTVVANQILTVEVEGMTCEMGCGGSIRKELKATGGVNRVEFIEFTEGQKKQTAKISYDKNKVTADEMTEIIRTMNDKQFKVKTINTESIVAENTNQIENRSNSEEEKVKISTSFFILPNLFDILSRFVR